MLISIIWYLGKRQGTPAGTDTKERKNTRKIEQ